MRNWLREGLDRMGLARTGQSGRWVKLAVVLGVGMGAIGTLRQAMRWMGVVEAVHAQAVTTTTVQGTVYLANGMPGSGTVLVSWPAFTTAAGQQVAAGTTVVTVGADGFLSVNLAPNAGATPAGQYYTAVMHLADGTVHTQYWQVRVRRGVAADEVAYRERKLRALRRVLEEPNASDSFRTLLEQAVEDALTGGYGAIEMERTGDPEQPAQLWPVDGATIRVNAKWDGDSETPRYEQVASGQWLVNVEGSGTSRQGIGNREQGIENGDQDRPHSDGPVVLRDDQLMYMRVNPRSWTPFGLGPLEVAFETVNQFLSANRFAGKLAANSVVQYALWLNEATPSQHERMIRWWQDEIEGTGRVPLISTEQKPEVLRFAAGTDADLRLAWQEFLIRMVANAFGLPPMLLGLESDVNRATAAELADEAFRGAIEPLAKLIAQHITRDLFGKCIGWREFEFVFNDLSARDEETELAIQVQLLAAGVYTVDEVRAMRGLAPLQGPGTEKQGLGNRD